MSEAHRTSCEVCREVYAETGPPCSDCYPGVHKYNAATVKIYGLCSDQLIVGPSGVVGMDGHFINWVMSRLGIAEHEQLDLSVDVRNLGNIIFSEQHKAADKK